MNRYKRLTIALTIAMVIAMTGNVLAVSCWGEYQDKLMAISKDAESCVNDIPWGTVEGAVLGNQMMALCGAKQASDAIQAEVEYATCISAGPLINFLKGIM